MIQKTVAYSAKRGQIAFTIPLFDQYMQRRIPDFSPANPPTKTKPRKQKTRKAKARKNDRQGKLFD
jgi:hypothetical protein